MEKAERQYIASQINTSEMHATDEDKESASRIHTNYKQLLSTAPPEQLTTGKHAFRKSSTSTSSTSTSSTQAQQETPEQESTSTQQETAQHEPTTKPSETTQHEQTTETPEAPHTTTRTNIQQTQAECTQPHDTPSSSSTQQDNTNTKSHIREALTKILGTYPSPTDDSRFSSSSDQSPAASPAKAQKKKRVGVMATRASSRLAISKAQTPTSSASESETVCPVCKQLCVEKNLIGKDCERSVGCSGCPSWFHFHCVGLSGDEPFLRAQSRKPWYCVTCKPPSTPTKKRRK